MIMENGVQMDCASSWYKIISQTKKDLDSSLLCDRYGCKFLSVRDTEGFTPLGRAITNNDTTLVDVLKKYVESPDDEISEISSYERCPS